MVKRQDSGLEDLGHSKSENLPLESGKEEENMQTEEAVKEEGGGSGQPAAQENRLKATQPRAASGRRMLLEEVGRRIHTEGDTQLWEIENLGPKVGLPLPERMYVVTEPHGARLHLSPMVAGTTASHLCEKMTRNMVTAMHPFLLPILDQGMRIRTVKIPNGGSAMSLIPHIQRMLHAHGRPGMSVPVESTMKIKRVEDKDEPTGFRHILLGYSDDGRWEIEGDFLGIADWAWASGETGRGAAKTCCEGGKLENGPFVPGSMPKAKKIFAFLGVGSFQAASVLYSYCLSKGIDVVMVFSNAIYDVTPGGQNVLESLGGPTDLSFANPLTITTEELNQRAIMVYGNARICVVSDTGNRLMDILLFFQERLTEIEMLKRRGTPVPLEKAWQWKLAIEMFAHPVVKKLFPHIVAKINGGESISPSVEQEFNKAIMEVLRKAA